MQDFGYLTTDGYTWTRDFCNWWFSIDLTEFDEGQCYVFPRAWKKQVYQQAYQRTYIYLYREKHLVLGLGYINSYTGKYLLPASCGRQIMWMGIDKFIEEHWQSIVNVAKWGIEGCLLRIEQHPCSIMIEHVLNKMSARDEGEYWTLEWSRGFPQPLDARTERELLFKVIPIVLAMRHVEVLTIGETYAEVKPLRKAGLGWLVSKIDNREGTEQEVDRS